MKRSSLKHAFHSIYNWLPALFKGVARITYRRSPMQEKNIKTNVEDFSVSGFLSAYTEKSVHRFRESLPGWVQFFEQVNQFAFVVLGKCQVKNKDPIALLALSTFSRALVTFEGSFLLAERGLDCDSKSLQRNLTEDSFLIAACARNRDAATKFIYANEEERRKAINALLRTIGATTNVSPEQIAALKQEQEALEAKRSANTLVKTTYGELADAGNSKPIFDIHYRFLSLFTHPSPSGMAHDIVYDESGKIQGVHIGPDYHDAHGNLSTATFLLLRMLTDLEIIFQLGINTDIEDLERRREVLNTLSYPQHRKFPG
jgi:Family of unknown function (DUF5677)